jgi:hypothetical protein
VDYARQSITYLDYDETVSSLIGLCVSAGIVAPVGALQFFAGAKAGFSSIMLGDYWSSENWEVAWDGNAATSLTYGLEAGLRAVFARVLTLTARLHVGLGFALRG